MAVNHASKSSKPGWNPVTNAAYLQEHIPAYTGRVPAISAIEEPKAFRVPFAGPEYIHPLYLVHICSNWAFCVYNGP